MSSGRNWGETGSATSTGDTEEKQVREDTKRSLWSATGQLWAMWGDSHFRGMCWPTESRT